MAEPNTGMKIGELILGFASDQGDQCISLLWKIPYPYYFFLSQSEKHYHSPYLQLQIPFMSTFRLELCRSDERWYGLYLWKRVSRRMSGSFEFTFGIRNPDGTVSNIRGGKQEIRDAEIRFGVSKFLRLPTNSCQTPDRRNAVEIKFTENMRWFIFCALGKCPQETVLESRNPNEVRINPVPAVSEGSSSEDEESDDQNGAVNNPKGIAQLSQDMKDLLLSERLCDVKFLINDEELQAHRNILAARSPVFSAMFEHEMAEKNTGLIEISDSKVDVFKEFILYLYTGKIEEISQMNVCGVYVLADKYDVKQLKEECIGSMKQGISVDNFCDVITLAVKYKDSGLLKNATDYFVKNTKSILQTAQWQTLISEAPTVANELFLRRVSD